MKVHLERFLPHWWPAIVAVVVGGIWFVESLSGHVQGNRVVAVAFSALIPLGCAFTGRYRLPALLTIVVLLYLQIAIDPETLYTGEASGLVVALTAAMFGSLPRLQERLLGLFAILGGTVVLLLRVEESAIAGGDERRVGQLISNLVFFTIAWAIGWIIASRVRSTRNLRDRAAKLEAERDALAKEAVAEERGRIARELHDVVAHSVSVMTVQAGGVRRLLRDEQQREREALQAIEETGRRALAEMRRMVGVMRTGLDPSDRAPQPGLENLDHLVGEIRESGLPVALEIEGDAVELPAGLDLSAYRIVQEALTNALKHAGPAHAWVTVRYAPMGLEILVEDDGAGPSSNGTPGHGLIGMRERVAVYGGTLETGTRPGGGFRLRAMLPLDAATGEKA
jgi:signal transduction histidine kinase